MEKDINTAGSFPVLTDEERLLISRAAELSARSQNLAVASCFLSPREQRLIFGSGSFRRGFFFGGCVGCCRRRLIFLPEWLDVDVSCSLTLFSEAREAAFLDTLDAYSIRNITDEFISSIYLRGSGYEKLSHRDWLGAIMALGIKREMLGDICQYGGGAYLFADPKTAAFICAELKKAGRDTVKAELSPLPDDFKIINDFEEINTTVASMRLDGLVRSLCKVSRDEAAELVVKGMVEHNYFTECNADKKIDPGDIICVRGSGKFIIDAAGDVTRKGRIRIAARKYI